MAIPLQAFFSSLLEGSSSRLPLHGEGSEAGCHAGHVSIPRSRAESMSCMKTAAKDRFGFGTRMR